MFLMLWTKGGALGDIQKTAAKETRSNDIQRKILIVNKTYIVETPHWQEATIKRPSKWGTKQKDKHLFFMKRYEDKIPQPLRCHSNPRFGSNYSCVPTVFFFFLLRLFLYRICTNEIWRRASIFDRSTLPSAKAKFRWQLYQPFH